MTYSLGVGVPKELAAEAAELTKRLHDAGWASHVSVARLLRRWAQLAGEVQGYEFTVDDYTNDLTARDAIEALRSWCSQQFGEWMQSVVDEADRRFLDRTVPDDKGDLRRYFRVGEDDGRWWRRRPASGPLANYLDGALADDENKKNNHPIQSKQRME